MECLSTNLKKYIDAMKTFSPHFTGEVTHKNDVCRVLEILCDCFGACRKFIALEEVKRCAPCDGESPKRNKKEKLTAKKQVPVPPKKKVCNCVSEVECPILYYLLTKVKFEFRS